MKKFFFNVTIVINMDIGMFDRMEEMNREVSILYFKQKSKIQMTNRVSEEILIMKNEYEFK